MRSWPAEVHPGVALTPDLDELIAEGWWGDTGAALRRLEEILPELEHGAHKDALFLGLYGRVMLQRLAGVPVADVLVACDTLERVAVEARCPVWTASACALRASLRMDSGDVGAAMVDLARVDLEQIGDGLETAAGARLLHVLATAYARLRLVERLDEIRARLDESSATLRPVTRATHWAAWASELAGRAMEPLASGSGEPDQRLLGRAVEVADRVSALEGGVVLPRLRRTVDGVRAVAAAYRGRPSEALRLLGPDAFGDPKDLAPLERQVVRLAAMHAHALVGSIATARSLDDAAVDTSAALPHLVLEVCRARERLWLEIQAGGDVVPVLHRLTGLLVRLGWQGMDLVKDTARQALEHQALRTESRTDPLTGAGNRRALDEDLRQILRFSPLPMSLVLVDVDDFKGVNDRFTHVIGDEVLRRVAGSLSGRLRVGDRLLRYGGDEFVVLLPRTGDQEARQVAARMSAAIAALPWGELAEGLDVRITTGCAALWSLTGRRPERDAEQLFRRADEALLEAKRQRPGRQPADRPWRGGGRRAALREAPGPTLAPPDRLPAPDDAGVVHRGPTVDVTEAGLDRARVDGLLPGAGPTGDLGHYPLTGPLVGARRRALTPASEVPVLDGVGGPLTPPRGQEALIADLLDSAETLDEAVSHVTAPGIPVITEPVALSSGRRARGRRAVGPEDGPHDRPHDRPQDEAPQDAQGHRPDGDDRAVATPSGARRPTVIDLDNVALGSRRASSR